MLGIRLELNYGIVIVPASINNTHTHTIIIEVRKINTENARSP